ncbi:MAG: sigma-70 family RNA polymerase sigma factor [Candidatus Wallbacteria bacterium]|nr:sigma-70 family RNA polymerase sigma factor [Candidatus Wallbacteria bacterium]
MDVTLCREYLAGSPDARRALLEVHRERLTATHAQAQAELGTIRVDPEVFFERVLRSACERVVGGTGPAGSLEEVLQALHYPDLLLACAMAGGQPASWEIFSARFGDFLLQAARRLTRDRSLADEVASEVMADLFFTDRADGRSRIMSYTGASTLSRWLWLVLRHRIIDLARRRGREVPLESVQESEVHRPEQPSPRVAPSAEQLYLIDERRRMLSIAIPAALADLDESDRLLLKLVYVDCAKQRDIAALYRVHESRISRWIDRVRREMVRNATLRLTRDFKLGIQEAASLVRAVSEADIGADLSELLASIPPTVHRDPGS